MRDSVISLHLQPRLPLSAARRISARSSTLSAASSCESLARAAVISRPIAVADSSIGEGKDAAPARPSAKMNLSVW